MMAMEMSEMFIWFVCEITSDFECEIMKDSNCTLFTEDYM